MAGPHDGDDCLRFAGTTGYSDGMWMFFDVLQGNAGIARDMDDVAIEAAIAAKCFATGHEFHERLCFRRRKPPPLGHRISPANPKEDNLGLLGQDDVFPGLLIRIEQKAQSRRA